MRNVKINASVGRLLAVTSAALASLLVATAQAAAPGVKGTSFDLSASPAYISQPDGSSVYSWGYGCNSTSGLSFVPFSGTCPLMQLPGPTLIVTQGQTVTVTLHNNLPAAAGNTSILFPGFNVCAGTLTGASASSDGTCTPSATNPGVPGVLAQEAVHGQAVTYSFYAGAAGTHSYYSGTQGDLQIEMGLYGALIVLPNIGTGVPTAYASTIAASRALVTPAGLPETCFAIGAMIHGGTDFRLAAAAYDHPSSCYEREYLFQFSEMDPRIHQQAEEQSAAMTTCVQQTGCMKIDIEPYVAAYFMINGRSFPDLTEPNYAGHFPHQPYNGNPHMHPGEQVLLRIIGQGRMQHPFHEHGNHTRVLARDGHMLLTASTGKLAGPLLFTTTTTPGQAMDGIFQWTAKNLNWDVYGHTNANAEASGTCVPDGYGYYTTGSGAPPNAPNYYEWCADHNKPLENKPFGNVGAGGPVTLPDPNLFAQGPWYGGSAYLGPDATVRSAGSTPIPPSGTVANSPTEEAGYAFMWHSHNERELTTNNIFPGGMMMLMLVDPWAFAINEAN